MLSAMNKAPPIYTDGALAREEAPPVEAGDKEVSPDGGAAAAADTASTVSRSPASDSTTGDTAIRPSITGIGVLIVNLGTPDAPTPAAVRRYLKEFLTDPRVIEKDSIFWKLLLNTLILSLRSRRRARDYERIWNREKDESPFKTITRSQAEKLSEILEPLGKHVIVDWAMRYGNPSIASRLEVLVTWGCERILIMPLYPQYSAATTATVCDEVFRFMLQQRRQPALRVLPAYYEDPYYIEVLATDLLRAQLGLDEKQLMMSFQSRFGRAQWLEPYTINTVRMLARKGVKNLVVITPGFSSDCLETLEEIRVENARMFKRHGGQNFAAIPCLNDSEAGMLMLWQLAMRELKGWV